jgi:hypothetical protein
MMQSSIVRGHDALAFLENWDSCDFVLATLSGEVSIRGDLASASITLPQLPGTDYFQSRGADDEVLQRYWSGLLRGMSLGYDKRLALSSTLASPGSPWTISASYLRGLPLLSLCRRLGRIRS